MVPIIVLSSIFVGTLAMSDGWFREDVTRSYLGASCSLAFDSSGTLHIAYHAYEDGQLVHAYRSGNSWIEERVSDAISSYGMMGMSMLFDSQGRIHISGYLEKGYGEYVREILYAVKDNGQWIVSEFVVDKLGSTCMALDSQGRPHLIFSDAPERYENGGSVFHRDYSVKELAWTGNEWINTTILTAPEDKMLIVQCAKTDSNGDIHVLATDDANIYNETWYAYESRAELSHFTNSGGTWRYEKVLQSNTQLGNGVGGIGGASLAVDSSNHVHLACCCFEDGYYRIKYANNTFGAWVNSSIRMAGDQWIVPTSIALDEQDHAFISYYEIFGAPQFAPSQSVVLAANSDGPWKFRTIQTKQLETWFASTSTVVDDDNGLHTTYFVYAKDQGIHLMYATNTADSLIITRALTKAAIYAVATEAVVVALFAIAWHYRKVEKSRREFDEQFKIYDR